MAENISLRRHTLWMASGQGISLAFQAIYFLLIGRTLGSYEYGAFAGVVALINALSQFSSLGMEMILVRNISRSRESFRTTWGNALQISTCGFFLVLAFALLLCSQSRASATYSIYSVIRRVVRKAGHTFEQSVSGSWRDW